jgi:hypothetical protein
LHLSSTHTIGDIYVQERGITVWKLRKKGSNNTEKKEEKNDEEGGGEEERILKLGQAIHEYM